MKTKILILAVAALMLLPGCADIKKLEDLKDSQYDAIKAYNDTKDAIVDLTKERVDAIKEGIEKEIEAYEEEQANGR